MLSQQIRAYGRPGQWIHVRATPHRAESHGQILEVLGRRGHELFRVRWDDGLESLYVPTDGDTVVPWRLRGGTRAG
jgi:Domain of unknown function (DUF1918)